MSEIYIISGNLGCGKSEVAINLALNKSKFKNKVAFLDIDIVNPYFCSREYLEDIKENSNISLFAPNSKYSNAELMLLTSEQISCLNNQMFDLIIIDVGGGLDGLKALLQIKRFLNDKDYKMIYVSNMARPETNTIEKNIDLIKHMEKYTGIKFTDLISNTHYEDQTELTDIINGDDMVNEICKRLNLSYLHLMCLRDFEHLLIGKVNGNIFGIKKYLKVPWN